MGAWGNLKNTIARSLGLTDPRLYHYFSGGPTYAGEVVSVETALQLDTVWACVRLISQTIATLPLYLYKRDGKGRGVLADKHPLFKILHDRPNAGMTATDFWEAQSAARLLWGNSYSAIETMGEGARKRVTGLTPLRPDRVQVKREADGSLSFHYSWQGQTGTFREDEILHVKGFSLDGIMGLSPIAQARQSLGSAIAAERAAGTMFKNGMRPSAVMTTPNYLTPAQREQATGIIETFSGAVSAGRVPLVEGGWKLEPWNLPPKDAELLATRSFHVEQICRWFDVPPAMIGHMEKSTAWGTGLEQMLIWFLTFALRPHLRRVEQAISRSLLSPIEQADYYAEFNADALLRADSVGRSTLYKTLAENGLRTRNELRALDNMSPMPGGDSLTVQANLLPIDMLGKVAKIPTETALPPEGKPEPAKPADGADKGNANG